MTHDVGAVLVRAARRNGWTEQTSNSLDYYTHGFTRPEPGGRSSVLRVRVTHQVVDALVDIGGLRQSFTAPTLQKIESILASAPPRPVHHRDISRDDFVGELDGAVTGWRSKHPRDLADAVRSGDRLADAASRLLQNLKQGE
jgi:hypothetical protein